MSDMAGPVIDPVLEPAGEEPLREVRLRAAERLTFFSDAVLAIAMTLLALELPVPAGSDLNTNRQLLGALARHRDEYVAFLVSFVVVATYWTRHHKLFTYVTSVPRNLARWNMLWLLSVVLTPFATRMLTGDGAFQTRFTLYATTQALAVVWYLLMLSTVDKCGAMRSDTPPGMVAGSYRQIWMTLLGFVISIPVSLVTHWAYACWVAIPVVLNGWHRVPVRRRGSRQ
jgi:uncharacterized membrane protein